MEATTPELGPVHFWSPKSSSFSGSYSIVSRRSCKKLTKSTPSVNKSGAKNCFIQHDKVEDSKLRRYLEITKREMKLRSRIRRAATPSRLVSGPDS